MGARGLVIRDDVGAAELRRFARGEADRCAALRALALAQALEGASRAEAARLVGRERQSPRDAVVRLDAEGLAGRHNCPRPGRPGQLSSAGTAGAAEPSAANRTSGVGACRTGPGWHEQLSAGRHRGPHRTALVRVVWAVAGVAFAAPHGLVVADHPARPPRQDAAAVV